MKNLTTSTPHDAVFKKFLHDAETARDFLSFHLPPEIRKICDLNTLRLESGSFIEDDLRARYSDVLYTVKMTTGNGYIYVLIEHQSTPDRLMAFRLMRYAMAAMQHHLDAGHKILPLVVPMLFYHGSISPYPFPLRFVDLFSDPQQALDLYSTAFPLIDITAIEDDVIMKHRRVALLELLQKHIRQRDMTNLMERIVTLLLMGYTSDDQLKTLLNYLAHNGEIIQGQEFFHRLAQRTPQHKETLMTIAEQLEQKGREEGRRAEALRIARTMLLDGLDGEIIHRITGIAPEEFQQPEA